MSRNFELKEKQSVGLSRNFFFLNWKWCSQL